MTCTKSLLRTVVCKLKINQYTNYVMFFYDQQEPENEKHRQLFEGSERLIDPRRLQSPKHSFMKDFGEYVLDWFLLCVCVKWCFVSSIIYKLKSFISTFMSRSVFGKLACYKKQNPLRRTNATIKINKTKWQGNENRPAYTCVGFQGFWLTKSVNKFLCISEKFH